MTIPNGPTPASPSPASMPRRITPCTKGRPVRRNTAGWVVAETLDSECAPSVILDGPYQRRFANLNRASIATTAAHARHLTPLVQRCTTSRHTELDQLQLPSGATLRIIAAPIFGPGHDVYGVSLWSESPSDTTPAPPTIGAIEWDATTLLATLSPSMRELLDIPGNELLCPATFPDLLARFDRWNDRTGLMSLLDPAHSSDNWIGTATTQSTKGLRRHFHIAAKTNPSSNTIRALVCDISDTEPPPTADSTSAALRRIPITPGHAVGIVDLAAGLIHEWIADEPFASWRSRNPEIHPDDLQLIADTCANLLAGTPTATITGRIRFHQTEDWIPLQATWTRITDDDRPQALLDVVTLTSWPPPEQQQSSNEFLPIDHN